MEVINSTLQSLTGERVYRGRRSVQYMLRSVLETVQEVGDGVRGAKEIGFDE